MPSFGTPQISIVIPCLNEAKTIALVIGEALEGIRRADLQGEVIVSDNGSTDGSQDIATNAGARVVPAPIRGYGAALHFGILAAQAPWVLFGDADMSYDFKLLPRFKEYIEGQKPADLVLGSRLGGIIDKGAMPFLNRHLGTPVLNFIIRLFFGLNTSDCNSGQRLIRREFYERLPMRAPGMEWASELLIKSKIMGMRYAEVPVVLRPDLRGRPPHLRRWRDGWRHLKSIVLLSPNRLILLPSLLILAGAGASAAMDRIDIAEACAVVAIAGLLLGLLVKFVLHADRVRESRLVAALLRRAFAEAILGIGVLVSLIGVAGVLTQRGGIFLVVTGALLINASFAWGTLVTHCLHSLSQNPLKK